MAVQITFANKTDSVALGNPANEKVSAVDLNEIKSVVNQNAVILDTTEILTGTVDPIGNVLGNPGDLYKQVDTVGFNFTLFQHVGVVANNTDWSVVTGRVMGVLAGGNTPTLVSVVQDTFVPVLMPLTISTTLRVATPSPGILDYTGPHVASTARLHMIVISGQKVGGGGTSPYQFILRQSLISGGGFLDIGFGVTSQFDNVFDNSITVISSIIGVESGDQYQLFCNAVGHGNDFTMNSIQWTIY